jgi:uncharacterized protein (TIGR03435 family)
VKIGLLSWLVLPAALAAADVSGAWTGSVGGPIYIILKQDGTSLSGSGGNSPTEQIATFKDGRVEGDRLIFRVGPFQFDLQVQGDRITGEAKSGDQTTKVFLRRVDSLPKRAADAPLPAFEVASVKPAPPPVGGYNSSMNMSPGRLTATNVSIKKLMVHAYDVKDYQIAGPDWLGTVVYSVTASMPADTTREDLMLMMQRLLADRFQLAFHRETREMPVYELIAGKAGPKLKPVEVGKGSTSFSPGKLTATGVPLRNFVEVLSRYLNRPVLDRTGLTGAFDFTLEFSPDRKGSDEAGELPSGASLFTAIQEQLGLKLEARKEPIEILVVDRAEKVPTGN